MKTKRAEKAPAKNGPAKRVGSGRLVRRIRVHLWIDFFGHYAEHYTTLDSPAVSNQPDPLIQHEADCCIVKMWMRVVSAPEGTRFAILGPAMPLPPVESFLGCLSDEPNVSGEPCPPPANQPPNNHE